MQQSPLWTRQLRKLASQQLPADGAQSIKKKHHANICFRCVEIVSCIQWPWHLRGGSADRLNVQRCADVEMPRGRARSENELRERISIAVRPGEDMDVDELVNVLRDVYPEYRRQKLNPFTRCVEEVMNGFAQENPAARASSVDKVSYAVDCTSGAFS